MLLTCCFSNPRVPISRLITGIYLPPNSSSLRHLASYEHVFRCTVNVDCASIQLARCLHLCLCLAWSRPAIPSCSSLCLHCPPIAFCVPECTEARTSRALPGLRGGFKTRRRASFLGCWQASPELGPLVSLVQSALTYLSVEALICPYYRGPRALRCARFPVSPRAACAVVQADCTAERSPRLSAAAPSRARLHVGVPALPRSDAIERAGVRLFGLRSSCIKPRPPPPVTPPLFYSLLSLLSPSTGTHIPR